jgi:MFS family permease
MMTASKTPLDPKANSDDAEHVLEDVPLEAIQNDVHTAEIIVSTPKADATQTALTPLQRRNVLFLVLAFSCVVAGLTLIVGTGPIVIRSIGGSPTIAAMTLACFFVGMSIVSLTLTHWIFDQVGRKLGFWCGCFLTVAGAIVGGIGIWMPSPVIVLLANVALGAGAGIGMYVRFASVEVVPPSFASKAVTWTLCGGCLAAFVGPEVAAAVIGVFGDGSMTYLGVFIVTICFAIAQAAFVGMVRFDNKSEDNPPVCDGSDDNIDDDEVETSKQVSTANGITVLSLLRQPGFLLPLLVSVLSWSIMAQPMSIFRVTMQELGFTDRESLTVMEFHFLSMYAPGFFSGWFIKKYGTIRSSQAAIACFLVGTGINLSTQANNKTTASWFLGLIVLGIGWNFGFSGATVWVTKLYADLPTFKSKIQAANEAGTFFLAGMLIFSTSYMYDAGGAGLDGWRALNYFVLALIGLLAGIVSLAMKIEYDHKRKPSTDKECSVDQTIDINSLPEKSEEIDV